ncbi:MAG TPA: hypothetical protein VKR21_06800 [Solirubrobacteraceae bacterium]|nr:hypothetical protein [Solirubrobacteraceae bacterium]
MPTAAEINDAGGQWVGASSAGRDRPDFAVDHHGSVWGAEGR